MKNIYFFLMLLFTVNGVWGQNVSATWGINGSTAWYTAANWAGGAYTGVQGAAASNSNIATFATGSTGNPFGINMGTASLNLGAISVDNTRTTATNITNSSGTAGVLRLYGTTINSVANVIIRNNGTGLLTLQTTNTMGLVISNATDNIINIDNTGGITIASIISGANKLTKAGAGAGVLLLSGVNTFTGGTTITTGTLTCGIASTIPSTGTMTLNGGTLRTGSAAGFTQSTGTLSLTDNSFIALGTGIHNLSFANSSAVIWTAAKTLTITGWTGGYNGTTGTAGKIFVGADATGLTAGQLAQIQFKDVSNNFFSATILATGEVVPASAACVAPTTQASAITFSNLAITSYTVNWTVGNGNKRVVIMNTTNSFTNPGDGTDPAANPVYGGSGEQVVYNNNSNTVNISGLTASTTYWLRVYEYNCTGVNTKFNVTTATNNPNSQVTNAATPTITTSVASLTSFGVIVVGANSAERTYQVSGAFLTNDIAVTAPAGVEISLASGSYLNITGNTINLTQTGGTVALTDIYARYTPATANGAFSNNIDNISTGAVTKNVAVTGAAIDVEPTTQSAITFGAITTTSIVVNFSGGNGAKRLLLAKSGSAVNSNPVDATTYIDGGGVFASGTQIGTLNYVVYAGTGNTVTVTGLTQGTVYHFAVYEYNDNSTPGAENYMTSTPGIANATTDVTVVNYTWIGGNSSWATAANWSPTRTTPGTTDVLQFNDGTTVTVTGVPAQTIRQLLVSNNTIVNLQAPATATLTIAGGTGTDLDVAAGSQLNSDGAFALTITLGTGATGSITGNMTYANAPHKLDAADASAIIFNSPSVFTQGIGCTGSVFNTTGTAGVIVFATGTTFIQNAGSNPFALTQPASKVVFQAGSLFKVQQNAGPSFSGRTYANLEINFATFSQSGSGANTLNMDNLTITQGTLNLGMTGTFNLKGNISVATGATLNFAPASISTLTLNGSAAQSISNSGTLTFGTNQSITVNNANGITLNTNIALGTAATLTLTNGKIILGSNNLSVTTIAGGSLANYIQTNSTGSLTINNIAVAPKTLPIGNAKYNPLIIENGSGHNWTANVGDGLISDPGFPTNKAVLVTWNITPSVNPPAAGADITFQFDEAAAPAGQTGANFTTAENVQAWHRTSYWIPSGSPAAVSGTTGASTVKVIGITQFSPYALSNISGPLPITINYFTGSKQGSNHLLNWKVTCNATPKATMILERSGDSRNFSGINTIVADAVRCDQPFNYIDAQPLKGMNYYRLKMIDADGKITYSSIVALLNAVKGFGIISIAPNPVVDGNFKLNVTNAVASKMDITIVDMQGRLVQKQNLSAIAGFNSLTINVNNLAAGTYTIQVTVADEKSRIVRFVKQ